MFSNYLKSIFEFAFRASWRAVNGIVGGALSLLATLVFGPVTLLTSGTRVAEIANSLLSFIIYAVIAFLAWFAVQLIFVAPFQTWKRDRRSRASGPEIIFNPDDAAYVRPINGLHGQTGEFFSVAIRNPGDQTLYDIAVRALDSWFTRTAIAEAQTGQSTEQHQPIQIIQLASLHPHTSEIRQLFGISYHSASSHPEYIYNTVQRFTIEASARDISAVRVEFEYDPNARPMLRIVD